MIVATDVRYDEEHHVGLAAAVGFGAWTDEVPTREWTIEVHDVADYVPGAFYTRELPCLLELLEPARDELDVVVVDGHVWLGEGQPGLGHYLHEALGSSVPVVGVAKSRFHGGYATEVLRGDTTRPLYVTAIGLPATEAVAALQSMHGPFRLPTLLKRVDRLTRGDE